ncbi:hypothetical protein ASG31_09690 [Chryseobacterium sp. Leaf404]|uniref:DUF6261 family protein n=1 Tax=unclassified Chryseobacterium TaxID=2593645 RepID=UPI0006F97399|nr:MULTISPECIES: DUF6261 family protein [unclassified Chryseobacterium]KQT17654.1 hypothetical protein ASG31_09690 [Chryseobacterium sp. Leaf404]
MKISLQRLSTKDLATLTQRILELSNSGKYTILNNHPLVTELATKYADYDAVYTKQTFSGKGKDVAVADGERDRAFSSLKAFLDGYRQLSSVPNFQLAEDLYQVFVEFGLDLDRMSYSSQTAQMKKLIETLELPENTQKLAALSVSTAFAEMKTKHQNFEMIFGEQANANAGLRQMASASSIRRDLEQTLKAFLNLLTAMKNVTDWKEAYAEVYELVKAAKNSTLPGRGNDDQPQ